jgi:hypothetical protein
MLSVTLFGAPQLSIDAQPLDMIRRKNRALMFYIAAHERPVTRDQLLVVFWPDHDRAAAQQTLRTMLIQAVNFEPAGLEGFFRQLALPVVGENLHEAPQTLPDMHKMLSLANQYGLIFDPPKK